MTSRRTAEFLRSIAVSNEKVFAIGTGAGEIRQDLAYFLVQDWILVGYWNEAGFLYLDRVVSPDGEVGSYGAWRTEGTLPEDLLTSTEFAWLWSMLDRAPVTDWTDILTQRVKAAGRVSA